MSIRFFWCVLSLFVCLSANAQNVVPLPQLNKEFQVVAHIIFDRDSTLNGIDSISIASDLAGASAFFQPIAASFKLCKVNYIYNFQYTDTLSDSITVEIDRQHRVENRINIYYIHTYNEARICGKASTGAASGTRGTITIRCGGVSVLTHELGHYFGLLHTFDKNTNGPELVNRTPANCNFTGDLLCDTPADPYTSPDDPADYVVQHPLLPTLPQCLYYSYLKDAQNQFYNPDVSNIMSYYPCPNGAHFTPQQYLRMVNTYRSGTMQLW